MTLPFRTELRFVSLIDTTGGAIFQVERYPLPINGIVSTSLPSQTAVNTEKVISLRRL